MTQLLVWLEAVTMSSPRIPDANTRAIEKRLYPSEVSITAILFYCSAVNAVFRTRANYPVAWVSA